MSESLEEQSFFYVEKPLRLTSGEEVTLITQASDCINAFSCKDVRIYAGDTFHDRKFSDNAIMAYKSVFQDFLSDDLEEAGFHGFAHEIYNARMYGPWWENGPSGLKDFAKINNESYISHDFVDFEFFQEVYPVRVSVIELCNPGSIVGIWAKDSKKQWQRLWSGQPQCLPDEQRIFSPPLRFSNFKTRLLRLELDHSVLDYCAIISGVFLIGTLDFIVAKESFRTPSLVAYVQKLKNQATNFDQSNLTPDLPFEALNDDLLKFEIILSENCILYKSSSETTREFRTGRSLPKPSSSALNGEIRSFNETYRSFDHLSDEIMLKILQYLDLKSLCSCSQVNNRFNCLVQDSMLYTSLNLKPYWNLINNIALNTLSSRCKHLQCLDISWCGSNDTINPEDFNNFLHIGGIQLTHLRLYCCDFVDDSVIKKISLTCNNLKELCLSNSDVSDIGFQSLEEFESLERLELYRADIEDSTLCSIIRKNSRMRHLNLTELIMSDLDNVALAIADSCPYLESIVCCYTSITAVGIRALARCINLREVDFGYCRNISRRYGLPNATDSLRNLFARCTKLNKVVLTGMTYLTDSDLEPLLFRQIQQLHVGGAKWLSSQMCERFIWLCPQLQMIDLNMCHEINDTHVKKWRDSYPKVSIKWSDAGTLSTSMFL